MVLKFAPGSSQLELRGWRAPRSMACGWQAEIAYVRVPLELGSMEGAIRE